MKKVYYFVYVLQSLLDNSIYIGYSVDPIKRLEYHNQGNCSLTKESIPWQNVFSEKYPSRQAALHRIKFLKEQTQENLLDNLFSHARCE